MKTTPQGKIRFVTHKPRTRKGYMLIKKLPKKTQKLIKNNMMKRGTVYTLNTNHTNLESFLYGAFIFKDSPQGHKYWMDTILKYKNL